MRMCRDQATIRGRPRRVSAFFRYAATRRPDLLFAEHLGAIELGNRRPAQLADFLGDLQGPRLELRRVEVPAAQLDLASAVLDIGSVMLGKELDLARRALEAVMLLESRQQDLADQPRHLALLRRLHRQDDPDRLGRGRVIHIE